MATVQKKIIAITQKILPAGSSDVAVLVVQNVVHHESVVARLVGLASTPAGFLMDRQVIGPLPALRGAEYEKQPDGTWKITRGEPIWAGQSLATCERQVNLWGLRAFRAEAQHERTPPEGQAFGEFDGRGDDRLRDIDDGDDRGHSGASRQHDGLGSLWLGDDHHRGELRRVWAQRQQCFSWP